MTQILFNAAEARQKVNNIANEGNEKLLIKVSGKIIEAVNRGNSKITVGMTELNPVVITHLSSLGYVVRTERSDPCSGGSQYVISWE